MTDLSLLDAFVAGVFGFISPGVLPLIPGYLFFVSGVSLREVRDGTAAKRQVVLTSLFFIVGFSLVFVSLGAPATGLGQFLTEQLAILGKIAGVLLVIFGLRALVQPGTRPARPIGAVIVGMSFAFGWTPAIGPILAAILFVAAQQDSAGQGILLLSIYSLGLAIPFLLTALAINQLFGAFSRIRRHSHTIDIVSGVLMIVTGVLIATSRFTVIAQWLTPYLPTL